MVDGTVFTQENGQAEFIAKLEDLLGMKINVIQPDHDAYYDVVGQTVASGDWPDVMILSSTYYAGYAEQGVLWDMTDAYASSDLKTRQDAYGSTGVIDGVRLDGKLYGMPAARGNGCVTYVKKAWLDNCGLDVPTNYDEYLAMLEAFTTGDPDGNGVNGDTYGVSAAGFIGTEAPYTNYLPEFYQDANPSFYKAEDGTWKDGFTEDSMKSALERMAAAYKEGVIDPTTLTNGTSDCRNKFYDDSFGVFTYWAGTWATNLKTNLEANGKDGELVALPPIAEVGQYLDRVPPVWCITSACENPEGVFKYFIDLEVSIAAGLAFFYVVQLAAKVLSYESFGAGNQNLHYFARFSTPFNSFWIYSRAPILAIVSSKLRRYVLSELNSSMVARFTSPLVKYWS